MPTGIGLMGLGRIGRNIFRILYKSDDLRIEAVSDVADPAGARLSAPLRHHPRAVPGRGEHPGRQPLRRRPPGEDADRAPRARSEVPPWGDLGVDTVIEATSKFRTRAELERHLGGGAPSG